MNVRHALAAAAAVVSIVGSGSALAAGSYQDYNLTVPSWRGSSVTNNRVKASAFDKATVCSRSVGGNYTLSVRVEQANNTSESNWGVVNDLDRADLIYSHPVAGRSYHIRLSNGTFTPVDVQGTGKWSPDNPGVCGF